MGDVTDIKKKGEVDGLLLMCPGCEGQAWRYRDDQKGFRTITAYECPKCGFLVHIWIKEV